DNPPGDQVQACKLNSQCASGLVCSFGLCHAECAQVRDCPANQRCVTVYPEGDSGEPAKLCQLQEESKCQYNSDCHNPLVCAVDLQCRNQCHADRDCNVKDQVCVYGVCANPDELKPDGTLKGAVPGREAPGSSTSGMDAGSTGGSGGKGSGGASGMGT